MTAPQLNTILSGNVFDVLPTLPPDFVDLSVTSPPYNKGNNKGWLTDKVIYNVIGDDIPEDVYQKQQVTLLDEVFRITKSTGHFFYNHKVRYVEGVMLHPMDWIRKSKWAIREELIWNRPIASNIRGWRFWQTEERIYWLQKEAGPGLELQPKDARMTSVWSFPAENGKKNLHPAPFPLVLPTRIIMSMLGERSLVFDPYAGSGTTLVAAKLMGHDYLGLDISDEYIKMANARLDVCEKERSVIDEERKLHFIKMTYKERVANGAWKNKRKRPVNPDAKPKEPKKMLGEPPQPKVLESTTTENTAESLRVGAENF